MSKEFEVVSYTHMKNVNAFLVRVKERVTHVHRDIEIGYVIEGTIALRRGSEITHLKKGDLYIVNRMEPHEFLSEGNGALLAAIQISPKLTEGFLTSGNRYRYEGNPNLRIQLADEPRVFQRICGNCIELTFSYLKRAENYDFRCFSLAGSLTYQLHAELPWESLAREDYDNIKQRANRIMRITEYIDQNFTRKLLLSEIAEEESLSLTYLSHFFKDNLGMSFQEYLNRKRFEHACYLLFTTNQKILDISISSGFSDVRYFNETFTKHYGCSPREYRKDINTNKIRLSESDTNSQYFFTVEDSLMILEPLHQQLQIDLASHSLSEVYA